MDTTLIPDRVGMYAEKVRAELRSAHPTPLTMPELIARTGMKVDRLREAVTLLQVTGEVRCLGQRIEAHRRGAPPREYALVDHGTSLDEG